MGKVVRNDITAVRARSKNALNGLDGFLRVTPRDVFFHPVEHLLDIYPYIPGPDVLRATPFKVFRLSAINLLIIATENLGDIRVFGFDIENGIAFDVVEKFLTHRHPVLLGAISPLVSHCDEAPTPKRRLSHHDHEVGEGLETVILVGAYPDVEGRIRREESLGVLHPFPAPIHELP